MKKVYYLIGIFVLLGFPGLALACGEISTADVFWVMFMLLAIVVSAFVLPLLGFFWLKALPAPHKKKVFAAALLLLLAALAGLFWQPAGALAIVDMVALACSLLAPGIYFIYELLRYKLKRRKPAVVAQAVNV